MGGQFTNRSDVICLGDCDARVEQLCELLGWREELDALHAAGHAELRKQWSTEKSVAREEAVVLEKDGRVGEEGSKSVGSVERLTEALAKTTLLAEGRESEAKGIMEREELGETNEGNPVQAMKIEENMKIEKTVEGEETTGEEI